VSNGRVYFSAKRTGKYLLSIPSKESTNETNQCVVVEVEKRGDHMHAVGGKMSKLREATRKEVVEQCLMNLNGSATAAVDVMITNHHLAGK
jgi:hypothetical protein